MYPWGYMYPRLGTSDLDDFVDELDSRHDDRRIKLHDIKFRRRLYRDLCENYIAHCLFV